MLNITLFITIFVLLIILLFTILHNHKHKHNKNKSESSVSSVSSNDNNWQTKTLQSAPSMENVKYENDSYAIDIEDVSDTNNSSDTIRNRKDPDNVYARLPSAPLSDFCHRDSTSVYSGYRTPPADPTFYKSYTSLPSYSNVFGTVIQPPPFDRSQPAIIDHRIRTNGVAMGRQDVIDYNNF